MQDYLAAVAFHGLVYALVPSLLPAVPTFTGGLVVGSAFYASWKWINRLPEANNDRFRVVRNVVVVALGCLGTVGGSLVVFTSLGIQVALPQLAMACLLPVGTILIFGGVVKAFTHLINKIWKAVCILFL